MKKNPFEKKFIFITGTPRSGSSMLTKVIDAHPDIAMLMENNFGNRRRHWEKNEAWNSPENLIKEVEILYSRLKEPIIGNKVCTPDVWCADDINMFCRLFKNFKILFIVRDPGAVALSRQTREVGKQDYSLVYNEKAKENILLNFKSQFHTYISSWRQSIETYWKLTDVFGDKVKIVYYEDFCDRFEEQAKKIFNFLDIKFSGRVLNWYKYPHYDGGGNMVRDLKYKDAPVFARSKYENHPKDLSEVLKTVEWQFHLWENRKL
ncbi:MAG: sulfotransferase [Candidatus Aminicenantes bacterium]|nr:sulfotransferase [Candidatus Aminicenantes bacterium]